MAVAVVDSALLGVGEHGVRFAHLFESLLRIRIVGIAVGMKLKRKLAVRALKLYL